MRRLPLLLLALSLCGCRDTLMYTQPKPLPLREAALLAPDHTVSQTELEDDPADAQRTTLPVPLTSQLLERGQNRFNIYCTPCHGLLGDGHGMVALRGFPTPPTYHSQYLRQAPVGHFFDVISHGFGRMPRYGDRIAPDDRWAIVAYIRALQRSQHATLRDVPEGRLP